MNDRRMFFAMCGVTALLFCLLVGGVAGANVLLQGKAKLLHDARLDNRLLEEQQLALVQANKDIAKYSDLEKVANTIVPQDKDQARTVRELVKLASDNGIALTSVAFATSTLGQPVPKATSSDGSTTTAKPATCSTTQLKPVDGIPGVCQMEVTLQSDTTQPVPYSSFIGFLSSLERNRRTAHVSNITITPNTKDLNQVTFSLGLSVFIKP